MPVDDNDWLNEAANNTFAQGAPAPIHFPCGWDSGSAVVRRAPSGKTSMRNEV